MIKNLAMVFGAVLVLLGVLGFIPTLTESGTLFGIEVDATHNIVHLITGLLAFWMGRSEDGGRRYFQIFGVVYALVALLGFMSADIFGLMANNMVGNYVHLIIAIIALALGFAIKKKGIGMPTGTPGI